MEKNNEEKFSKYVDPTGEFSNRELKLAEWYLKHKLKLQDIGKWFLIVWCVITIGYSFGYWLYYGAYGYFQDQKMNLEQVALFQNYEKLSPIFSAQDLQIGSIDVYNSVTDKYDLVARVVNPNPRWVAKVSYKFVYDSGETSVQETVLWPKSTRPIIYFGAVSGTYPTYAKLVIEKIDWRRINQHVLADVDGWIDERIKFGYENFNFIPANRLTELSNNIIEFEIFNSSVYSFWNPTFYVELKDGEQTVGFMYLVLDKFKAGEQRQVSLRSFVDNLQVSDIVLWPAFDVFDRSEYMPVES